MILRENLVDTGTGQTYFSGERVTNTGICIAQQRMNWLHPVQVQLRIDIETNWASPGAIRDNSRLIGDNTLISTHGQNTPVNP